MVSKSVIFDMGELFPSAPVHLLDELFMKEIERHIRAENPEVCVAEAEVVEDREDLSCRLNNVLAVKKEELSKITAPIKRKTIKVEAMPQHDIDTFMKRCLLSLDEETTYVITFSIKNPPKTQKGVRRITKKNIDEAFAKCVKCFKDGYLLLDTNVKGDAVVTKRAGAVLEQIPGMHSHGTG